MRGLEAEWSTDKDGNFICEVNVKFSIAKKINRMNIINSKLESREIKKYNEEELKAELIKSIKEFVESYS